MPQIESTYIETGRVRYIFRPMIWDLNRFPADRLAAESLYCAGEQGKFWEMHDWVIFHVDDWVYSENVTSTLVLSPSAELGLDPSAMEICLLEGRYRSKLESILADARSRGVDSTPTFQINERPLLIGARPFEEFERIIEEELAR